MLLPTFVDNIEESAVLCVCLCGAEGIGDATVGERSDAHAFVANSAAGLQQCVPLSVRRGRTLRARRPVAPCLQFLWGW